MKKIWFIRKHYGWGWMPSPKTWEGWAVIVVLAIIIGAISQYLVGPVETGEITGNEAIIRVIILSLAFAGIIYLLFKISDKYGEDSYSPQTDKKDG